MCRISAYSASFGVFRRLIILLALTASSCRQDMHDQPKLEPFETSTFFADGRASRPLVEGTVPRGIPERDPHLLDGKGPDGKPATTFPYKFSKTDIERGRERYDIYCAPCHARTGDGEGMIVRRGYRKPPSFHEQRLREAAPGYLYDVIANGFGAMPDYRAQIPVRDRWAIVAYIRALQLSRHAKLEDVPAADRAKLEEAPK